MKVIGAGFPKTGTKSFWRAMEILGYNHLGIFLFFCPVSFLVLVGQSQGPSFRSVSSFLHLESPIWVDHLLDDFKDFMSGEIDFETVCKKIESMEAESCSGIFQNFRSPESEVSTYASAYASKTTHF